MKEFEIDCVSRPHPNCPHEHITHVGNAREQWRMSKERIIYRIEARTETFFMRDPLTQKKSYLGVVHSHGGSPYLRGYAEGRWNNILLAQAECGPECKVV